MWTELDAEVDQWFGLAAAYRDDTFKDHHREAALAMRDRLKRLRASRRSALRDTSMFNANR